MLAILSDISEQKQGDTGPEKYIRVCRQFLFISSVYLVESPSYYNFCRRSESDDPFLIELLHDLFGSIAAEQFIQSSFFSIVYYE